MRKTNSEETQAVTGILYRQLIKPLRRKLKIIRGEQGIASGLLASPASAGRRVPTYAEITEMKVRWLRMEAQGAEWTDLFREHNRCV